MKEYSGAIKRFSVTLLILSIVQLGNHLNLPGTTPQVANNDGIMNFFASISAGKSGELTLFSLGLSPYMISFIVWNLFSLLEVDAIKSLSQKQSGLIVRAITLLFAILQAWATLRSFEGNILYAHFPSFSQSQVDFFFLLLLTSGGMVIAYIADLNKDKGVGKQMILIFPGLLANMPRMLLTGGQDSALFSSVWGLVFIGGATVVMVYVTSILARSEYRIPVQQTAMTVAFKSSYIPIKVLTSGAFPFMFGITLFSMPQVMLFLPAFQNNNLMAYIVTTFFSYSTVQGILTFGLILGLLGFGFSHMNIRPFDIAKGLRGAGDYIFDVRPGRDTEKYIRQKLNRIIFLNNSFILLVSLTPLLVGLWYQPATVLSFYFSSLVMMVYFVHTMHEDIRFVLAKRHYVIF